MANVLVIDDDPDDQLRDRVQARLEQMGHQVAILNCAVAAILFRKGRSTPDLGVNDLPEHDRRRSDRRRNHSLKQSRQPRNHDRS